MLASGLGLASLVAAASDPGSAPPGPRDAWPPAEPLRRAPRPPDDDPTSATSVIDALIDGLIATHDLASTDAQRTRIETALRAADVVLVTVAVGAEFEPGRHHAVDSEPASEPEQAGNVARVVRPGWQGAGRALRVPEVVVWR